MSTCRAVAMLVAIIALAVFLFSAGNGAHMSCNAHASTQP